MENQKETKITRGTMMALLSILFLSFMICFSTHTASAQKLFSDTANSLRTGSLPKQPLDIQYDETGMVLGSPPCPFPLKSLSLLLSMGNTPSIGWGTPPGFWKAPRCRVKVPASLPLTTTSAAPKRVPL